MANRHSKLTPDMHNKLVDLVASGNYYSVAARCCGITYNTFNVWMRKGEKESSGRYHDLYHAIRQAESENERDLIELWQSAMHTDWKAIAHFLERKYPHRYGKKDRLDVEHDGQIEINPREKIISRINRIAESESEEKDI